MSVDLWFSPRARAQAITIQAWWIANRPAAPELFDQELAAVIDDLRAGLALGTLFATVRDRPIHRVLMPRSRYHLYYRSSPTGDVEVIAVWHTSRGSRPRLA